MSANKPTKSFLIKRRNTIVAFTLIVVVLIAGYFVLRGPLLGYDDVTTLSPSQELLPGEALYGNSTLIYPRIDRKNIKSVKVHNPANEVYGKVYVDWGIGFAYDKEAKDYYGFMETYNNLELDDTQLAYFAVAAGHAAISARVEEDCKDFSPYGLDFSSEEKATYIIVEKTNGEKHKLYIGKKNLSGTGYYVRSGDTYTDENGQTRERNTVYLLNTSTTGYYEGTVLAKPTAMLSKRITFPIKSSFSSFVLQETGGDLSLSFLPTRGMKKAESLFGGSSIYYTVTPKGYFSSSAFETRIMRFENFVGLETLEYATTLITGVDEETKEEYEFYGFDDETLQKYGLDPDHIAYVMMYTAATEGVEEHVISEVYFSEKQTGGYYYAYSLCYNTILRVSADMVDFLEWELLDFVDSYALRMSIGYCNTITFKGVLDGQSLTETFSSVVDAEYTVKSAYAETSDKEVNLNQYRILFQEIYTTMLRGNVPEDLDKEALMAKDPYFEIAINTRDVTVYVADEFGNPTTKVDGVIESVTRYLRFYQYSNGRAMMTVETVDKNGKSSGEVGQFYVLVSRLDKLISDCDKLVKGESFSYYDKE